MNKHKINKEDRCLIDESQQLRRSTAKSEKNEENCVEKDKSEEIIVVNSNRTNDSEKLKADAQQIMDLSKSGVEQYNTHMEQLESLISLKNIILRFIACYLIPKYKKERKSQYYKLLLELSMKEIQNAQLSNSVWQKIHSIDA